MLWKLFRPKPIVVIELPYKGSVDPELTKEVVKTMVDPLKKDYHVLFKFTEELPTIKVEVHNGFERNKKNPTIGS
jgi:hypothetical protein